jgi:quercetin dioxygenase-like cupin family protein
MLIYSGKSTAEFNGANAGGNGHVRYKSFHRMTILAILLTTSTLGGNIALADESPSAAPDDGVKELMVRTLAGASGKEVRLITVAYPPGGASPPHRHQAQVFVYVLEGSVKMQLDGSPPVTLRAGDTFYEGPNDIHAVSANASQTMPARLLVFIVKDKGKPLFSAPSPGGRP